MTTRLNKCYYICALGLFAILLISFCSVDVCDRQTMYTYLLT